uniref:Putative secreted protein n=1 Tax=Ixodes ricinus TaxID=34613 RepID=A0A6B0UM44_IXORI
MPLGVPAPACLLLLSLFCEHFWLTSTRALRESCRDWTTSLTPSMVARSRLSITSSAQETNRDKLWYTWFVVEMSTELWSLMRSFLSREMRCSTYSSTMLADPGSMPRVSFSTESWK